MIAEGLKLAAIAPNIAIKVPLTWDGLTACKAFASEGHKVNVTLCFSAAQAILAAKAGASLHLALHRPARRHPPRRGRADPGHPHHLRQLRLPDRDSRRLDPLGQPYHRLRPDRCRCHHRAAGGDPGDGEPCADRQGSGAISPGLGKNRAENPLTSCRIGENDGSDRTDTRGRHGRDGVTGQRGTGGGSARQADRGTRGHPRGPRSDARA